MTLDEAIEFSKYKSNSSNNELNGYGYDSDEHKQLYEWLEELKQLRFFRQEVMESEDGYLATMCEIAGYNKAIDEVKQIIHNIYAYNLYCIDDLCDDHDVRCEDCLYSLIERRLEQINN